MLKKLWIYFLEAWARIVLAFWFRELKVYGRENIPRDKAVIFLPKHQNTFLDPVMQAACSPRISHFMARGDLFSNPLTKKLAASINLRPIYRPRDAKNYIQKNEEIFDQLQDFLGRNECITLYAEGTHNLRYRLLPFKKGFVHIAFGALEKYPHLQLQIVPVGINYSDYLNFRSSVSIHFGEAFDVKPFFEMENRKRAASELRKTAENLVRNLVINLPKDNYLHYHKKLKDELGADFSNRELTQRMADDLERGVEPKKPATTKSAYWWEKLLFPLVFLNNIVPILIWKRLKSSFKDYGFYGAVKFSIGMFIVPVVYLVQSIVVWWLAGLPWALVYLFLSMVSVSVLRIRRDRVPDQSLM